MKFRLCLGMALFTSLSSLTAQGNQYLYGGFQDLSFGTAGTHGIPYLTGTGSCAPNTSVQVSLTNARSLSNVSVISGFLFRPTQVFGGVLAPTADILFPVLTDGNGSVSITLTWPILSPGIPILFQAAIVDPVATGGMALSNVVRGETSGWGFYQVEPESTPKTKLRLVSTDQGTGLGQVLVTLTDHANGNVEQAKSDMDGYAVFPNVIPPTGLTTDPDEIPGSEARLYLGTAIAPTGYVPQKKTIWIAQSTKARKLFVVPLSSGSTTGVIGASVGATLALPNIGTLTVPAGALSQDARLQVVVVPTEARTRSLVPNDLRYQVWISAVDSQGNLLPGVMTGVHAAGVTLKVALADQETRPGAITESWTSVGHTPDFSSSASVAAAYNSQLSELTLPLIEGNNCANYSYAYPEPLSSTGTGEWQIKTQFISRRQQMVASTKFKCGKYANSAEATTSASQTVTSSWSRTVGAEGKVGWKAGVLFAKASAELSVNVSGTWGGATATTKLSSGRAGTPASGTFVEGGSSAKCLSGCKAYGLVFVKYKLFAFRRTVLPSGTIVRETEPLGTLEVCAGAQGWVASITWDPSCIDCTGSGDIPGDIVVINTPGSCGS